jgi:hypothetical protein
LIVEVITQTLGDKKAGVKIVGSGKDKGLHWYMF